MRYNVLFLLCFFLFSMKNFATDYNYVFRSMSRSSIELKLSSNTKISEIKTMLQKELKTEKKLELLTKGKPFNDNDSIGKPAEIIFFYYKINFIDINVKIFGNPYSLAGLENNELNFNINISEDGTTNDIINKVSYQLNWPTSNIKIIINGKKLEGSKLIKNILPLEKKEVFIWLDDLSEDVKRNLNRQQVLFTIIGDDNLFAEFAQKGGVVLKNESAETSFKLFVTNQTTAQYIKDKIIQKFGWKPLQGLNLPMLLLVNGIIWEDNALFSNYENLGPIVVVLQPAISGDLKIVLKLYNTITNDYDQVKEFTYSYNGQLTVKILKKYLSDQENLDENQIIINKTGANLKENYVFYGFPNEEVIVIINKQDLDNYYRNEKINNLVTACKSNLSFLQASDLECNDSNKIYDRNMSQKNIIFCLKELEFFGYSDLTQLQKECEYYIKN